MADIKIVMTDTVNRLLPLAWGVAGGAVTSDNVSVLNGTLSVTNSNINATSTQPNTSYRFMATNNGNIQFSANNIGITGNFTVDANTTFMQRTSFTYLTYFTGYEIDILGSDVKATMGNVNAISKYTRIYSGLNNYITVNDTDKNVHSAIQQRSIITINNTTTTYNVAELEFVPASQLTVTNSVVNSDSSVFTNLQYTKSTPSFVFSVNNSISVGGSNTFSLLQSVPVSETVDLTALSSKAVIEITNRDGVNFLLGTLYIELYNATADKSSGYLILSTNNLISDQKHNMLLSKLINAYNSNNSTMLTSLTSDFQFRLYGNSTSTITASNLVSTINIYDIETAGSGGGGLDNTNLYIPYSNTDTYEVGDVRYYEGYIYECNTDITTPEAFNSNHWDQTSVTGELSTIIKYINSLEDLSNVQF